MISRAIPPLALLCIAMPCLGVDPQRAVSQYVRERWGPAQGVPPGSIYAIAQTPDGYLWIGAEAGLFRYDGATFKSIEDHVGGVPVAGVLDLRSDRAGALWIRRRDTSLLAYRGGLFGTPLGYGLTDLTAMSTNLRGDLLVARFQEGAFTVSTGKLQPFARATGLPRSPVLAVAQTRDGSVWFGMRGSGLYRVKGGTTTRIPIPGNPDPKVNFLLADKDGLWIGFDHGLAHWTGNTADPPVLIRALNGIQVLSMTRDRDGNLWLGTNSRGLIRLNDGGVSFLDPQSYASAAITTVFEDREGSIWFGSVNGLERLRDSPFITFSSSEGLQTDGPSPVFVDWHKRLWFAPTTGGLVWMKDHAHGKVRAQGLARDVIYSIAGRRGELWLGRRDGGLTRLGIESGKFTAQTFTTGDGLAQNSVYSVFVSRDGAVWAGTLSGGVSRLFQGQITTFTVKDGLASDTVASIAEDADKTIWLATPEGLSALNNGHWTRYTTADGLPWNNVNCVFEDSHATLWVGTSAGLSMREGGRFSTPPGLPAALKGAILGIADDALGTLWITTSTRVLSVPRARLIAGTGAAAVREYGLADGLRGNAGVKRHQSVFRDPFGRIWISLNRGISMVDPARAAAASSAAPMVRIQGISADGRGLSSGESFHVPAGSRRVEFDYAGLSLSIPGRVRYRYLLEPYDSAWSEPVADRKASYTNLGPGSYVFRVIASNPDGVWGTDQASVPFRVDPQFWQTWWFRICGLLAAIAAFAFIYRWRMQMVTRSIRIRFEERISERTLIAQELHDTLLQGFLSASMQLHLIVDQVPEDSNLKGSLDKVLSLIRRVIDEGRNAVRGLRSSSDDSLDLAKALSRIPQEFPDSDTSAFQVVITGEQQPLRPLLRDEAYRIAHEAVVNAFRHAQADAVEVQIEYASRYFRILVRDNGCGIDPKTLKSGRADHWGLTGMRERAQRIGATLRLSTNAASGTEVELTVPSMVAFRGEDGKPRPEESERDRR